ncbi:molybdenum ABC transporter ATP-binding protein ModC [Glaesserella parasuis]|uniref:molybdenum ABC transporter ATP-binding protein ModC n=1 Tax=Glaesserella parasuis TaxID=738 RepID=UPI00243669D1|nr:molybdenum ABC transporter ATP-binding protein ModC [Glaesserella parasuis]MDG6460416.1 molybdenum ABC transporter ATP-binding protein ModC [Glaesserella parasuis]MDG6462130.1 molybdenum ABC transporter ATP-binding protein ModC [Glaesserella parasuis]MDG6467402.1 molybdenum ABC transporter ATP-binding protein ModC [Glaesserella parasuis]MDG6481559.1 molybdenum ABC transporter ATP-binding protein ModC [Glaesserella parasuis]MDG6799542.1 molybdenum ABC transporter ATP-binding protein ModC [Gl
MAQSLQLKVKHRLGNLDLAVDVALNAKGVTAIFGRSGAGKSSLINLIAGLVTPTEGRIVLNGRVLFDDRQKINLPPEKRKVGYVFQEHRLFPHYRVEANLKYGCKRFDEANFSQLVKLLGIEHLLDRFPISLSGGEKQRVAIGRVLLSEPDILLMDEPLSALDLPRKNELMDYLGRLAKTVDIPILYVSHSLDEVIRLADNLLLLEEGKVVAFDKTLNVWHSPAFSAWQPEAQRLSLLELPVVAQNPYRMQGLALGQQLIWVTEQPRYQLGDLMRISIGSQNVSITLSKPEQSSIRNILQGRICKIEPQSDRYDIAVEVEAQEIWASISLWAFDDLCLQIGQMAYLQIKSVVI